MIYLNVILNLSLWTEIYFKVILPLQILCSRLRGYLQDNIHVYGYSKQSWRSINRGSSFYSTLITFIVLSKRSVIGYENKKKLYLYNTMTICNI